MSIDPDTHRHDEETNMNDQTEKGPPATGGPHATSGERYDAQGRRLCCATTRKGEPCSAPARLGQRVCRMHGGSSPRALAGARQRLADAVNPAIARLVHEVDHASNTTDRIRAANSILDRTGFHRTTRIDAGEAREVLYERLLRLRAEQEDE